jgi:NAD(P)-dependent dehydrogenase (short-subunit alcohol dehydrogenase family)
VAARSEAELVETTSAIVAAGGRAHPIVADLAAPGAGTALARRARDQLGRVDILIHNAAVVAPLGASTDVDVEEFARAFTLNVTSVAELTFALLPGMLKRRWAVWSTSAAASSRRPRSWSAPTPTPPRRPPSRPTLSTSPPSSRAPA